MTCEASAAPYAGPHGRGQAIVIFRRIREQDIDAIGFRNLIFLITPDGYLRELPPHDNPYWVGGPFGPPPGWAAEPSDMVTSAASEQLGGISLADKISLVGIQESADDVCFVYRMDYPFVVRGVACASQELNVEAMPADGVMPVPDAEKIAVEAAAARIGDPDVSYIRRRLALARVVSGGPEEPLFYIFNSYYGGTLNDMAVSVDGRTGEVRFVPAK
jgi:hypothetical protein